MRVPNFDVAVGMHADKSGDCGQVATIGTKRHRLVVCLVTGKGPQLPPGLRVPQPHRIRTCNCEPSTIGTELYAGHSVAKTQRKRFSGGVQLPDLHFPFRFGRPSRRNRQALAVRAEGYCPHARDMFQLK